MVSASDAVTNTITRVVTLYHETSATALDNFGVGINFESEYNNGNIIDVGTLDYRWDGNALYTAQAGKAEIRLRASGSTVQPAKMILGGSEFSFGGYSKYTSVSNTLGDNEGKYPNQRYYMNAQTTDATPTKMDIQSLTVIQSLPVPTFTSWIFTAYIVARKQGSDFTNAYWIKGAVKNNGGTIQLVGVPQIDAIEDVAALDATATNDAGSGLALQVTGQTSTTWNWNGYVDIVQVNVPSY
jgi:hypothetical protein